MDEATADALWGSARVVGQAVLWKGKTYYVRGVMEGERAGILLVQGGEDAEPWAQPPAALSGRRRRDPGRALSEPEPDPRRTNAGPVPAPPRPDRTGGLARRGADFGDTAAPVPAGTALTAAPLLLVCYLPPALLGAGAVLWCAGAPWSVPERFIPTRWSDFEFWVRLFSGGMEKLRGYLTLAAVQRDLRYGALAAGCALLSLTALALAVLAAERAGVRTERVLAVRACAVWALTFGIALVFAPFGGVKVKRPLWLLPGGVVAVGLVPGAAPPFFGSEKRGGTGR